MKCAIMQPTYLPWPGYFHLMNNVDVFILYDDVQFARRSWQQRNRIILQGKEQFMTVPVMKKGNREQLINEVLTDENQSWRLKHFQTIKHAYSNHEYGQLITEIMQKALIDEYSERLSELNIRLISQIKECLGIKAEFIRSSEIPVEGKKSEYLYNLCRYVGASTYRSPIGSKDYIDEEGVFTSSKIKVEYQNFSSKSYSQKGTVEFIPFMSVIDLLANIGSKKAYEYVSEKWEYE